MHIDENLLIASGARVRVYKKNEIIFREGEKCRYFYQISQGEVKMFNFSSGNKEFTQGLFSSGNSFGEPPVFLDKPYAASAMTTCESSILRMPRDKFLQFLAAHPELHLSVMTALAQRFYNKMLSLKDLANHSPEERILNFLSSYKQRRKHADTRILIPYTRQELANFTGMRVETVIRTLSKMNEKGQVEIKNRKLYF